MTTDCAPSLMTHGDLQPFFQGLVRRATQNQGVDLDETTEFYIVNLLSRFTETRELFTHKSEGRSAHEPLAALWSQAMTSPPSARIPILKRLGDLSLYVGGFFHASLSRRLVDVDYYISMGGNAYNSAASLVSTQPGGETFHELYNELSEKFPVLVDVLGEISEESAMGGAQSDLLRLYERWLHTGSARLAQKLAQLGILAAGAPGEGSSSGGGLLH